MIYCLTFLISILWVLWVICIATTCSDKYPPSKIPSLWLYFNTALTMLLMIVCAVNTLANL